MLGTAQDSPQEWESGFPQPNWCSGTDGERIIRAKPSVTLVLSRTPWLIDQRRPHLAQKNPRRRKARMCGTQEISPRVNDKSALSTLAQRHEVIPPASGNIAVGIVVRQKMVVPDNRVTPPRPASWQPRFRV